MKRFIKIIFAVLFVLAPVDMAQNNGLVKDSTSKTSVTLYNLSGENLFIPGDNNFRFAPQNLFQNLSLPGLQDSSTIWLRTKIAMMNSASGFDDKPVNVSDMLHPYLNFYIESKNISLFRRVLGMAQLGAAGYLAYKHIKKYGLFHQP